MSEGYFLNKGRLQFLLLINNDDNKNSFQEFSIEATDTCIYGKEVCLTLAASLQLQADSYLLRIRYQRDALENTLLSYFKKKGYSVVPAADAAAIKYDSRGGGDSVFPQALKSGS
ncbi:MAG: hypothetical protein JWQ96_1462 [Segetibacter sp.]|nr:hypothetical protein [Segetibacter sp.]